MGELQSGSPDEREHADRPARTALGTSGEVAAVGARREQRGRAEYAAEMQQRPLGARLAEFAVNGAADCTANPVIPDALFEAVRRFEPRRAGLPEVSANDAVAYIDVRQDQRPWLAVTQGCSSDVQRVFAALDQGSGHGHIRHEGWVTEEMNKRRVAYLEDPAQSDPAKRAAGIDGLKEGDQPHQCRQSAGRIIGPDAFAVAFAQGIDHPRVRAALETPFDADNKPHPVQVPIEELLGQDGHRYCTGWRLEPVDGSMNAARKCREAWITATDEQRASGLTEPTARQVETFEGGTVVFAFGHRRGGGGYEVLSMYPRPPEQ